MLFHFLGAPKNLGALCFSTFSHRVNPALGTIVEEEGKLEIRGSIPGEGRYFTKRYYRGQVVQEIISSVGLHGKKLVC